MSRLKRVAAKPKGFFPFAQVVAPTYKGVKMTGKSKKEKRKELEADVARFLSSGGRIDVVAPVSKSDLHLHARNYHKLQRALETQLLKDKKRGAGDE